MRDLTKPAVAKYVYAQKTIAPAGVLTEEKKDAQV